MKPPSHLMLVTLALLSLPACSNWMHDRLGHGRPPLEGHAHAAPSETFAVPLAVGSPYRFASAVRPSCTPMPIGRGRWITPLCETPPPVEVRPFVAPLWMRAGQTPREVDLRSRGLVGPVGDQGQVGVCWAFGLASTVDNALRRRGSHESVSALHVVSQRETWDALWRPHTRGPGLTLEADWAYDPVKACRVQSKPDEACERAYGVTPGTWRSDPFLVIERMHADATRRYRIAAVEQLQAQPANVDQLVASLAEGQAVLAVFGVSHGGWRFSAVADGVIDDYSAAEAAHAVAIVGYRHVLFERQLLLKNSWGADWGDGGYVWMPERLVRQHLRHAVRLEVEPVSVAPAPVPTCGQGQVRDLLTARCSAPCPGGHEPIAGVCVFLGAALP